MSEIAVTKIAASFHGALPACQRVRQLLSRIEARAYAISQERGNQPGHEMEDWLRAENETVGHARTVLYEDQKGYALVFEVPGFDAGEIEVAVTPLEVGLHALSAHRLQEQPSVWREFSEHEAYRRIHFPTPVDNNTVKASLDNGLVRVSVEKRGV